MSQYHEIGVPFNIDGTTLVARKSLNGSCDGCYCRGEDKAILCQKLSCTSPYRPDNENVVFDEIFPK